MKTAVVVGGIDELKGKNDVYGRASGSTTKAAISRAMAAALRSTPRRKTYQGKMTFRGTITVTESAKPAPATETPKTYKAFSATGKQVRVTVPED